MAIGSTNISMSAIAAEVLESQTNFDFKNFSGDISPARALVNKTTDGSQISFSDFSNVTGSVGHIAMLDEVAVNLNSLTFIKTIRNTSMTRNYAYFSKGLTFTFQVNNVNVGYAMTNDGVYCVYAYYSTSSSTNVFDLYQRSGSVWTKVSTFTDAAISSLYISWDPTGTYLNVPGPGGNIPLAILKRTGTTLSKIYTGSVVADQGYYPAMWNPGGTVALVFGFLNTTSGRSIFRYSRSGDTFTALASVASPLGTDVSVDDAAFKPDGSQMVVSFSDSAGNPKTFVYAISGTTYSKVSTNPTSLTNGAINRLNFSPDGVYVLASDGSKVTGYSVSGTTYTLITPSTGNGVDVIWCDGTIHAKGGSTRNNQILNQFSIGNPPTLLSSYNVNDLDFPSNLSSFSPSHRSVAGSRE